MTMLMVRRGFTLSSRDHTGVLTVIAVKRVGGVRRGVTRRPHRICNTGTTGDNTTEIAFGGHGQI